MVLLSVNCLPKIFGDMDMVQLNVKTYVDFMKNLFTYKIGRILLVPHVGFVYEHRLQRLTRGRKLALLESTLYNNGTIDQSLTDTVNWKYPGPDYVMCYSLNKTKSRDPDWNAPYLDIMRYPKTPKP